MINSYDFKELNLFKAVGSGLGFNFRYTGILISKAASTALN